ncbi:hypothetical protein niasHS_017429 [Heterodera schachtii]|uniref:Uncharacterized protein n=2 Tax=Heterodera TaxID=34509 RepID=A0ABD2I3K6_HETSC
MPAFRLILSPFPSVFARLSHCHVPLFRQCSAAASSNSLSVNFLSSNFALPAEWDGRLGHLSVEQLGGDNFEWIVAVQKKFTGVGKASAIDLDLACSVPVGSDHLADLVDLCYKFRHTDSAGDLLPSTEYTLCRLLLEFGEFGVFMNLLNDPINYGIFPNEHICCMFLDHFLGSAQLQYAAKIAIYVMLQEMFDFPLLTFLATRALLEWTQGERKLDEQIHPKMAPSLEDETNFNEENVRLFRYPFLKNPFWDGHFDENDSDRMAGKALEWLSYHLKLAKNDETNYDETLIRVIRLLGLIIQQKWTEAKSLAEEMFITVAPSDNARQIIYSSMEQMQQFLNCDEQIEEKDDQNSEESEKMALKKLFEQKSAEFETDKAKAKLSETLAVRFEPILRKEEERMMEVQRKHFWEWAERRKRLIHSQVQRAEHLARLNEIQKRRAELREQREMLFFFENRTKIEDEARDRTELIGELGLMKKKGELTEEEYAQGIFHLARQLKEGKTAKQALEEISGSDLFSRLQKSSNV